MRKTSFTQIAKRHFKLSLADQEPVFWDSGSVLAQQRHKDWPAHTAWAIGSSVICARLILDLLPKKHVRPSQMRYRDEPDVLLADIAEISQAAFMAVIAWELSGGDDYNGLVTLDPCEPLTRPSVRSRTKTLFKTILSEQQPVFRRSNDYLLVGQVDDSWRHPSHYRLGINLTDAQKIATFLPHDHVRHFRLVVRETKIQLAYVIMLSAAAMTAVCAWEECGRSNDVKIVLKKIKQLAPPVDE
jgi:hypothetical protein